MGKGTEIGSRHGGFRKSLVICEVTLSLVFLSGAGGLMQSFLALVNQDLGFNPHNLVATRIELPNATTSEKHRFYRVALDRVKSLPGVAAAEITSGLPPNGGGGITIDVPGKPHTEAWNATFEATPSLDLPGGALS
jgi:hypothetical protein